MFGMQDKNKREEASLYIKIGALIIGGLWVLGAGSDLLVKKETSLDVHNKKYSDYSTPLASHELTALNSETPSWVNNKDICTVTLNYSIENKGKLKLMIDKFFVEVFEINTVKEKDLAQNNVIAFSISKLIEDSRTSDNPSFAKTILKNEYKANEVIGHNNQFARSLGFVIKRDPNKFYTFVVNAEGGIWTGEEDRNEIQSFQKNELRHVSNTGPICEVQEN